MRTMYDSVDADAIPTDAEIVAGYVDGRFAWSASDWARFPRSVKVRISAIGATHLAEVFDVEVGCIWPPANVVPLVVRARAAGIDPTVYVNQNNDWGPTRDAFTRAGVAHPHWWVANYDGGQNIPAGAVAKQYAHPPMIGRHYDLSVAADFWPGVDEGDNLNPNGDDVSFNDAITNHNGATFSAGQWLTWTNEYAAQSADRAAALLRQQAIDSAKLDAVLQDGGVDQDRLNRTIDTATREATTKAVTSSVLPALRDVLAALLADDNTKLSEDVANAVLDGMGARLGAQQ